MLSLTELAAFAAPVVKAVLYGFCGGEPLPQPHPRQPHPVHSIMGSISFVGATKWTLILGLPKETAVALAKRFSGMEIPYESNDMADVVGEIANILAGHLSSKLEAAHRPSQMSIPTVVRGQHMNLLVPHSGSLTRSFYSSPIGEFWVDFLHTQEALVS